MNKSKGQSLVEFALVLPCFLFLIFALIYSGMLFYDYSTLSNIARSVARERAISEPYIETPVVENGIPVLDETTGQQKVKKSGVSDDNIKDNYFKDNNFKPSPITGLYAPGPNALDIQVDGNDILVTINMVLVEKSPLMEAVLPNQYSIVYHMRKDFK